jgi:hypothetical protein
MPLITIGRTKILTNLILCIVFVFLMKLKEYVKRIIDIIIYIYIL